jgi:hypothetical protein
VRGWIALSSAGLVAPLLVACSSGSDKPAPPEVPSEAGVSADGSIADDAARADAGAGESTGALRVSGNGFVDENGKPVRLLGVNHSGGEYMCVQGRGIFDSPADDALVGAILSWHANAVRIGLNEDCWLGINSIDQRYAGTAYQRAVVDFVGRMRRRGLYVIVEVHWSAPGTNRSERQQPMLDADHGLDLWRSLAEAFKGDLGVVFDLYNEPYLAVDNVGSADPWACWRDGCTITKGNLVSGTWASAGMQPLLDAVRATGAKNVVLLGGLAYANDLSGWVSHMPNDPEKQIAAAFHLYNFNACNTPACWNGAIAQTAAVVPVVTGEIGEDDCGHGFIDGYMAWADGKGVSYLGWTFNPWDCAKGPALVTDFTGNPTAFGAGLRDHIVQLRP